MRHIVALFLGVTLVGSSAPGWADSGSTAVEIGSAAGSAFGTMIYAPFKATFCILGGIGSGLTAIVSRPTAAKVAMATCGGSWTVTPNMMRGHESPKFIGDTTPHRTSAIRQTTRAEVPSEEPRSRVSGRPRSRAGSARRSTPGPGIGAVEQGMERQGFDLQLTRYNEQGWRATFYTTGMEHSPHRRERQRVGAHAAACDTAGGVGGAEA